MARPDQGSSASEGLADRQLRLLMQIDAVRDSAQNPDTLLGTVAKAVAAEIDASVSLLFVHDPASGEPELRAFTDRSGRPGWMPPDAMAQLAGQSSSLTAVELLSEADVPEALSDDGARPQLVVVPIVMGSDRRLGSLLLGRHGRPFEAHELELLTFAESQLDSALAQAAQLFEFDLRNQELETIYRFDRLRDRNLPFDEMLDGILFDLRNVVRADLSFIMLYDDTGKELETRASSGGDLASLMGSFDDVEEAASAAVREARLMVLEELDGAFGSLMCVPLILRERILGVFGMASTRPKGFQERERRLLAAIASQMDTAIFESLEQRRLRMVLGRSVDPRVMERLLTASDVGFLKGERQVLTVLYADLRGSTSMAEVVAPEVLVDYMNAFLGTMSDVILKHEGTLDKFIGDEVMALFGAPAPQEDHALRSVRVALAMQNAHAALLARRGRQGLPGCPMGVGIATGELIVGEMGSAQRSDYTAIGSAANLGARICGVAEGGQILVSPATHELVADAVVAAPVPGLSFKGISADMTVYSVTAIQ